MNASRPNQTHDGGIRTPIRTEFHVAGMTCRHCALSVAEEVEGIQGVSSVDVELATGAVTVIAVREIAREEVAAALSQAGFELAGDRAAEADSDESEAPERAVSGLHNSHNAYIDAIGSRLDLTGGLAQVRDFGAHFSYRIELAHRLDLGAGVAAVRRAAGTERSRPTQPAGDQRNSEAG